MQEILDVLADGLPTEGVLDALDYRFIRWVPETVQAGTVEIGCHDGVLVLPYRGPSGARWLDPFRAYRISEVR